MGALVAVFDPTGRIVRFNRACETTSGYDFATLVGRYAWDKLIPRQDIPEAIDTFERVRIYDSTAQWTVPRLVATARDGHLTLHGVSPAWLKLATRP